MSSNGSSIIGVVLIDVERFDVFKLMCLKGQAYRNTIVQNFRRSTQRWSRRWKVRVYNPVGPWGPNTFNTTFLKLYISFPNPSITYSWLRGMVEPFLSIQLNCNHHWLCSISRNTVSSLSWSEHLPHALCNGPKMLPAMETACYRRVNPFLKIYLEYHPS